MEINMKSILSWVMKDILPEVAGEYLGFTAIKNTLLRGRQKTEAGESSEESPEVKYGGFGNLSDERIFIRKLFEADEEMPGTEEKITNFIKNRLTKPWQRRRFRVISASMSETKKSEKKPEDQSTTGKGKQDTHKNPSVKVDRGVIFLKSFGKLSEDRMHDACQSAGILDSVFEDIKNSLAKKEDGLGKVLSGLATTLREKREGYAPSKTVAFLAKIF